MLERNIIKEFFERNSKIKTKVKDIENNMEF